jgi:nitroreductase
MSRSDIESEPYDLARMSPAEQRARAEAFLAMCRARRSVREFSPEPIDLDLIDLAIASAGLAPSAANQQPWTFVIVADPRLKERIREAAEQEERINYEGGRMSQEWRAAIAHLGTDSSKPHLTDAPVLIVVFEQTSGPIDSATDSATESGPKHYYSKESVGLATGVLLVALHNLGFATLTHTPSPMNFLRELLGRPRNEKAFVLIPVGYPAAGCRVPVIMKKPLDEIRIRFEADQHAGGHRAE